MAARKLLIVTILLASCREPPLATPVPELAKTARAPGEAKPAQFFAGESMSWNVYWRGFRVGRFDLSVSATEPRMLHARLHQSRMARNLHRARVDLATTMGADGFPTLANEDTKIVGGRRYTSLRFDGLRVAWERARKRGENLAPSKAHSLLSALGALRQQVLPRRLFVATGASLYELRLSMATRETLAGEAVIRVDAEAYEPGVKQAAAVISVWLSASARRIPARVDVEIAGTRLVAKRRVQ